MIQCNGVALRDVKFKKFRVQNDIFYDNICSLDIEVSTGFYNGKNIIAFDKEKPSDTWKELEPHSLLYLWNICIDGYLFSGRALQDLFDFLEGLNDLLEGTFFIYVHNLSYEFQFLRNILDDITVFARKRRKPMKFNWKSLEFRCSYMLTRLSLDTWAREKNLPIKKLTGLYDYHTLRTPLTKLTTLERDYGYNDVLVVVCGLQEYLERYKHIKDIPLTQTSCIRKEVNKVMKDDYKSRKKVAAMTNVSLEAYRFMIDCFMGGYTHANILLSNRVIENVWDFDISSSYPWAMVSEKFPCSPWVKVTGSFERFLYNDKYCCMLECTLEGVESIFFNTYISGSKCAIVENGLYDNGRLIKADKIKMRVLDVDFDIIKRSYYIEKITINELYYALTDYLPSALRKYLLQLFVHKTSLKGIIEKYTLYFKSKEELNGCYGMAVTKDMTDEILYINGEWDKDELTELKYYEKVEDKVKRLYKLNMSYSQGIYVPAYGRKNLWSMVYSMDDLIAYMDTDSLKVVPPHDIVLSIIDKYNTGIHTKQKQLSEDLEVPYEYFNPLDTKGKTHSIGIYERDDDIIKFKTLGAKRYICQYDELKGVDYLKMTVSGVQKKAVYQLSSIEDFEDGLVFTIENSNKLLLLYNDNQQSVTWNKGQYDEWTCYDKYSIAAYNIPYEMGVSPLYLKQVRQAHKDITKLFERKKNEK